MYFIMSFVTYLMGVGCFKAIFERMDIFKDSKECPHCGEPDSSKKFKETLCAVFYPITALPIVFYSIFRKIGK